MKLSDLISGIALIFIGTIFYYQNWKREGKSAQRMVFVGVGLIVAGALLAFGGWIIAQILRGQ